VQIILGDLMHKPHKIYTDNIEQGALDQFFSAMEQPFSVKGALMPDAHVGYSLPIGAVVATDGKIVPAWVGYDIGCGVCAIPTTFNHEDIIKRGTEIYQQIYRDIPVGFNVYDQPTKTNINPLNLTELGQRVLTNRKGFRSLGTLGGGNHFIEVGCDENKTIWIIIHSGSRGVGHGIAGAYMTLASFDPTELEKEFDSTHQDLLKYRPEIYESHKAQWVEKKMGKARPKEGHYAFDVDSDEGRAYINDMNWCLEFALENRTKMLTTIIAAIQLYCFGEGDWDHLINRNHNHATERDGLWIHRKGATHAEEGMMGVIPGNMRDGSFIVRGKGNPESLWSSSHGAGRVLGRKQAKRELKLKDFKNTMLGIVATVKESTLDECPAAYKNIFDVMEQQKELVDVVHIVKPLINIKG
jgi:tRNA-splicing ligase RtcB